MPAATIFSYMMATALLLIPFELMMTDWSQDAVAPVITIVLSLTIYFDVRNAESHAEMPGAAIAHADEAETQCFVVARSSSRSGFDTPNG